MSENPAEAAGTVGVPPGLGSAGRRLWETVVGRWECDPDELAILEMAAQVADEVMLLRAQLAHSSVMVAGSRGQERVHPAVSALAENRRVFASLMGRLRTPARVHDVEPSASSDAGRSLVAVRWEGQRRGA